MFMGEYQHTLDTKGRIIVPAKFREQLQKGSVITRGLDHCLFLFPPEEWEIIEQKLKSLPLTKPEVRQFVRFFFSGASECELDKQGRLTLPASLREYGKIGKDVTLIGVSSRIELWSTKEWLDYVKQAEEGYSAIAERVVDLGI